MTAPWISIVLAVAGALLILLGVSALWTLRRRRLKAIHDALADGGQQAEAIETRVEAGHGTELKDAHGPAQTFAPLDDSLFAKGLARSQQSLWGRMRASLEGKVALDAAVLEEIETILLTCDVGVQMTEHLMASLRQLPKAEPHQLPELARQRLRQAMRHTLAPCDNLPSVFELEHGPRPKVILLVGVNGVGKTTTIGKLSHHFGKAGAKVVLAAGDTFRAAAAEQLEIWAERTNARLIRGDAGADPTSVMFNAVATAKAQKDDVVLADTAGRLHNKAELMAEISKIRRALGKQREGAPDEIWLVVDATTGQNALNQAQQFHEAVGLTGLVLTKLDGTAKGGVALGMVDRLGIPIRFVGLGEDAGALQPFDAQVFVEALI